MGIAIKELLANEYFKDFEVVAGRKGLTKEIQGFTTLEAPDGFKWAKGKELVLSSGYAINQDPDCLANAFAEGTIQRTSGMMLKRDRYLDKLPEEIIKKFDDCEIPLIMVPFAVPWMEIISQTNVMVMNRTIMKFQISSAQTEYLTDQTYKEQKIVKTLKAVESEMKFPACLYDLAEEQVYYSSSNFQRAASRHNLDIKDFWSPSRAYTHHTLCDYINMSRYRLINLDSEVGPRVSWIIMPIRVDGILQAYFIVMEERDFIDYYDEFSIRIAYLMIQSLYEQISGVKEAGYIGFENFIHYAMNAGDDDKNKVISQAGIQGISMSAIYDYVLIRVYDVNISQERDRIMKAFKESGCDQYCKLAVLDEKNLLLLVEPVNNKRKSIQEIRGIAGALFDKINEALPGADLYAGICRDGKTLGDIKSSVDKCRKVLEIGKQVYRQENIFDYEMLGPLTWLDIPQEELTQLLRKFNNIQETEKGKELLKTLKIYLENNMNYSITAEKMYVHINTIRKRIDQVNEMLEVDWDNPMERVKNILLLQFVEELA